MIELYALIFSVCLAYYIKHYFLCCNQISKDD